MHLSMCFMIIYSRTSFFSTCVWWWVIFQFNSSRAYEWIDIHNMVADRSLCFCYTNNQRVFIFTSMKENNRFWMAKEVHCACYSSFSSSRLIPDSFTLFYNLGTHLHKVSYVVSLSNRLQTGFRQWEASFFKDTKTKGVKSQDIPLTPLPVLLFHLCKWLWCSMMTAPAGWLLLRWALMSGSDPVSFPRL